MTGAVGESLYLNIRVRLVFQRIGRYRSQRCGIGLALRSLMYDMGNHCHSGDRVRLHTGCLAVRRGQGKTGRCKTFTYR